MQKETSAHEFDFERISNFKDLFNFIRETNLGAEYEQAYETAAEVGKNLVENKSRSAWDPDAFKHNLKTKYPGVQDWFIDTLKFCIEHYNPPVNVPSEPLW